jgi:hypothetical protein
MDIQLDYDGLFYSLHTRRPTWIVIADSFKKMSNARYRKLGLRPSGEVSI